MPQPMRASRRIAMPPQITVTPASTARANAGGTNWNCSTPPAASAAWFRWNAGQTITNRSSQSGSGMNSPDSQICGQCQR